jgi:NAD-dependent deacetylase
MRYALFFLFACSSLFATSHISMSWRRPEGQFAFDVSDKESSFEIKDAEGKRVFVYPAVPEAEEENSSPYTIHDRLILPNEAPQKHWTLEELVSCIKSKRVVFYSGAGISAAAGIPTMTGLDQLFALHLPWEEWTSRAMESPQDIIAKAVRFKQLCHESDPTPAHHALRYICSRWNIPLWTENLDLLHQKSGIDPLVVSRDQLLEEVKEEGLKEIDVIVCLGLSFDDKGALGWYKHHHPEGMIVSIDLMSPVYLGEKDALLKGDLQEVLPILLRKLHK